MMLGRLIVLAALPGLTPESSMGQTPPVRIYLPNPADENWSFLKDPTRRIEFWDPLKYISLGGEDRFLTLSGEIRWSPARFHIHGVGEGPPLADGYLLQRYLLGANVHLSQRFRFYGELQSGLIHGKLNSPRPTDKNSLDLHQGFFEWKEGLANDRSLSLRVGRQELTIGSSRLISASPGLNVKRSFDGAALGYASRTWRLYGAVARLVALSHGIFDDLPDHEQTFWGFAASRRSPMFKQGELGFYYLGIDQARAIYAQALGRDQRHTLGVKWSGTGTRFDLNYDAIVQWGHFSGAPVRAWAFSTETGYRIANTHWKPRFSIRADFASGDKDPKDPKLQSFNPLFPGSSYAGAVGLFGPTNLSDVSPEVRLIPRRGIIIILEAPSYWRTSLQDGIYNTTRTLLIPPSGR